MAERGKVSGVSVDRVSKVSGKSEQGKRNKRVRCDKGCGEVFALGEMEVERLGDGVEKVFFVCPHCGKEYVCFYTDAEIRGLREQIRDVDRQAVEVARGTGKDTDRVVAYEQLHERHEKLRRQIDRKMAALRARVEGEQNG